jgi:CheY-like chemotaxis protein
MTNLVGNAIKFTPSGGGVDIRIARQGATVSITVRDTGRGMTADVLPFIFERFGRGKRAAGRGEGGLGLGLSIVRHLVELHGGRVTAESAGEGRGATFVVVLPLTDEVIEPPPGPAHAEAAGVTLRGRAVLVVEDDQDTRQLVALVLRDEGATVAEAGSIAEAVAAFARSVPDILVSDFTLPDGDGVELREKLRMIERKGGHARIPAIALTGLGDESERRRAMSAGYDIYLLKPFDPIELVDMVTKALGRAA